ncbi:hypothetical protein [Brevibacterium aurantiacum]|uniref:Uncharacterized protein n=1 Tax=Brevibacterium aurantiacum TaxID=273384 RepID=A0A2H1JRM3_BREAU|nr:hypothetical protein [Brevibacterium aurantiacum]SMX90140.1 hypothetical protein BAURA63_02563 [Brevibacterium aurantiacum]
MNKPPTNITGPPSLPKRLELMWARGLLWDHVALLFVGVWLAVTWWFELPVFLTEVEPLGRRAVFQTLAGVSGTMAGLTFTSISIMINLVKTPLSALDKLTRPEEKRTVGDVFLAVLPKLLLTFVFALITLAIEPGNSGGIWWIEGLALWFTIAAISGMARVVWVLKRLLTLS